MSQTLQEGKPMDVMRFVKILSKELSQTTANLLNGTLMGSFNNNSVMAYRRYLTNDYPPVSSALQECSSNIPYHIEWHQDFNNDCNSNNGYNTWYQNYKYDVYKFSGNNRYDGGFRYSESYGAPDSCFYDGCSKQLFCTTEW